MQALQQLHANIDRITCGYQLPCLALARLCVPVAFILRVCGAVAASACERIKSTPMPFGYVAALRGFLLLFLVTIPFTMIGSYHGFAIFGEALIAYIFLDLVSTSLRVKQLAARSTG